jgi:Flp pilus assembly protein TadG
MSASGQRCRPVWRPLTRAFRRARDGAIAVEMALVAPVILAMLLGIVEVSGAISANLSVQAAARAGTQYGLTTPPVQGDMSPIIGAARAAMPAAWTSSSSTSPAEVSASLVCECELTGAVACGAACAKGEQSLEYLKVDITKVYSPIVKFRYLGTNYTFKTSSQVRLK